MGDTDRFRPEFDCLFNTAAAQHGYFTREQADQCGFRTNLLAHHTRRGKFRRVHRGVYRLRDYPSSTREEVVATWLAVGKDDSVVSHETALELYDLGDIIPRAVHLTVPRTRRNLPKLPGVRIHTTTRPLNATDVTIREGIRVTSVSRTIADAAQAGTAPEQIEMAIRESLHRGLTTPQRLHYATKDRSRRVRDLVERSLEMGSQ